MRKEFGRTIAELVRKDKRIYVLDMDFGNIFEELMRENPSHHIKLGVCEQAVIGMASGMALQGLKPYVFAITPFLLERPFEQIKLDIVQQKANVKLVSYADYPSAGPTHSPLDVKKECKILGIDYIKPKNSLDTRKNLLQHYQLNKPAFFYLKGEKK